MISVESKPEWVRYQIFETTPESPRRRTRARSRGGPGLSRHTDAVVLDGRIYGGRAVGADLDVDYVPAVPSGVTKEIAQYLTHPQRISVGFHDFSRCLDWDRCIRRPRLEDLGQLGRQIYRNLADLEFSMFGAAGDEKVLHDTRDLDTPMIDEHDHLLLLDRARVMAGLCALRSVETDYSERDDHSDR